MNEIEEFYSYVEMPQVGENMKTWESSFHDGISTRQRSISNSNYIHIGEWTKASLAKRRAHVEYLLESLEHRDSDIRFTNARRLFYVLQGPVTYSGAGTKLTLWLGTFGETVSPEHQLHWIFENCKVVRAANGISGIVEALKIAGRKHDLLWYVIQHARLPSMRLVLNLLPHSNISDQQAAHLHISLQDRADLIEEVLTEVSVYLGMLYHLIEVFKGHDDFADELSELSSIYSSNNDKYWLSHGCQVSLDPPLPVYLFNVIANLRDKTAKGYPIKKVRTMQPVLLGYAWIMQMN
jgi:hypothetical protein